MTIVYIVALLLLFVFQILIKKQIKILIASKKELSGISSKLVQVLAWVTCLFAVFFWVFLLYWIINSWLIHIDPTKPKPHFIIVYVLGLFSTGVLLSFSKFFTRLNTLNKDEESDGT